MDNNHEDHFFKGLVFGTVIGVGLVWFLGTKEGQKFKDELLARGRDLLEKGEEKLEANLLENYDNPKNG